MSVSSCFSIVATPAIHPFPARDYGDAEERLGDALKGRKVHTTTKLAPLTDLAPDASRDTVRAAVDKSIADSLKALKRDALDCLLLHRAAGRTAFDGAIWRRLKEHLVQGTIDSLGVSVQNPEEAREALADLYQTSPAPATISDWRWQNAGVRTKSPNARMLPSTRAAFSSGCCRRRFSLWPRIAGVTRPAVVQLKEEARAFGCDSTAVSA
jgi:hypothetical protein